MEDRGYTKYAWRTLQRKFKTILEEYKNKRAQQQSEVQKDHDCEEDELSGLLFDLVMEIQEYEAEKALKDELKKTQKALLVAVGKRIRDKAGVDISSSAISTLSASSSQPKKRVRKDAMMDEMHERGTKRAKLELDAELRRAEICVAAYDRAMNRMDRMEMHRAEMALKHRELDLQFAAL